MRFFSSPASHSKTPFVLSSIVFGFSQMRMFRCSRRNTTVVVVVPVRRCGVKTKWQFFSLCLHATNNSSAKKKYCAKMNAERKFQSVFVFFLSTFLSISFFFLLVLRREHFTGMCVCVCEGDRGRSRVSVPRARQTKTIFSIRFADFVVSYVSHPGSTYSDIQQHTKCGNTLTFLTNIRECLKQFPWKIRCF